MSHYDPRGERATRDVVSRGIYAEMRAGRTSPMGGVYIQMSHLGAENVSKKFPGMVQRCAACGFDLAGGQVEVVPTAHYLMGGVEFEIDCSTASPGLFVAGEDAGGVHGANRLGGNGVANSTVFGGIAGDSMAAFIKKNPHWREPDKEAIEKGILRAERPFKAGAYRTSELRDKLAHLMWEDVDVIRTAEQLKNAQRELVQLRTELLASGVPDGERAFNLSWHDWLNLDSLLTISEVITVAALAREDSRGAHFREDFPETGALTESKFTSIKQVGETIKLTLKPVDFQIVRPGESLLDNPELTPAHL